MTAWLMVGCAATLQTGNTQPVVPPYALIEGVTVSPSGPGVTVVEVLNSRPTPFTTFKLTDPLRMVLDVDGVPGDRLPRLRHVGQGPVSMISYDEGRGKTGSTRITIALSEPVEYKIEEKGSVISLSLMPEGKAAASPPKVDVLPASSQQESQEPQKVEAKSAEPRIFFTPAQSKRNQVLGVDFTLLDHGKSRLAVTTDKTPKYSVETKGPKSLQVVLEDSTIPPLLQRHLDSRHFEGAVDKVKADFSPEQGRVYLNVTLRDRVPFHVDQTDKGLKIDFAPSETKPPEKKMIPLQLAETQKVEAQEAVSEAEGEVAGKAAAPGPKRSRYRGTPMTMDFVNADVTNILRLIGEVSNLNIVWGPEVQGKVSMRLKSVPWDQALDLVLANNNLGMRRDGNVIWVTTRTQLAAIEAEERRKIEDAEKRVEEERKRLAEKEKAVEETRTEYITINYVEVENIKKAIEDTVKSKEGKLTVDKGSKTIIISDYASRIASARSLAKRLDQPTKQVMIEARIVEASTSFSRNLGVQWNYQIQHRDSTATPWSGQPAWAPTNSPAAYPPGGSLYNPAFSTNHPGFGVANLGFALATLSGSGLTGAFLNTQIALSETEGEVKVLSSPRIVTQDTKEAEINQGSVILQPSGTDANGNKTYEEVSYTLKLRVTPKITPNNMVVMEVDINDDQPDYAEARGEIVPKKTKNAKTTMMVASGDTVIIGGIFKDTKGVTEAGQPWLKEIPILGWLFKTKGWSDSRAELLIFLTPTVMPAG
jgi:type IV pilus assembly protein PilQ